jgi:Domain of unknown function (DUF6766)
MSAGAWMMTIVMLITVAIIVLLVASVARSIRNERAQHRSVWREFGLSLLLMILFFSSWIAQGITQWQTFTDVQLAHGQTPKIGDFIGEFMQATLENWQSEFLQLFSFVVLAALYIHKGSSESKDGEEKIEASLRRIEEHLGILPVSAPREAGENWQLPDTPLETQDITR